MSSNFHNTTGESGETLRRYQRAAAQQNEAVAALFAKHAPFALSPSQVHRALDTRAPLTSIRRAITNLTNAGVLEQTDEKVTGPYGRPEHKWRAKREPRQERLFA